MIDMSFLPSKMLYRIKVQTNSCWKWVGGNSGDKGYGRVRFQGKTQAVHRVVWALKYDAELPDSVQVQHGCNNAWCCNPDHLVIGTASENALYRAKSGNYNNKFGVVGVTETKSFYYARGTKEGKRIILYRGPSLEEAIRARKVWEATCLSK
jgi:hypothetical protein